MTTTQKIFKVPVEQQLAELQSKFEQAPYPDAGVQYSGYWKRQLSGNKYELKPQNPYYLVFPGSTADGLITSTATYITAIWIWQKNIDNAGLGALGAELTFNNADNSSANVRFSHFVTIGATEERSYFFTFPTPLHFPNGIYYTSFGGSGTGRTQMQLWGWQE